MKFERLHKFTFICVIAAVASCEKAPVSQTFTSRNGSAPQVHVNSTDNGTFIDVYGSGDVYDFDQLAALTAGRSAVKRIGLYGLKLPPQLPSSWANLSSLRTIIIDCAWRTIPGSTQVQAPADSSSSMGGAVGQFGSPIQLESLHFIITGRKVSAPGMRNVSLLNCGIKGHYGAIWRDYLSDVQSVNLSGNTLTGDFTSIDYFDTACTDTFAGDDYGDPDCSERQFLDVSRNQLSGRISTGAALGDDITDAVCSTACITLIMAPGVDDPEVLCRAPLLIYTLDNPGLTYRSGVRFANGYVTQDPSNWCFVPASRWVLPTMWTVFLVLMVATLIITLYARVRLKKVPFRMKSPSFEVLARGTASSFDSTNRSFGKGLNDAVSGGGYASLAGGVGAVEMSERQAMIPKHSGHVEGGSTSSSDGTPQAYVNATALETVPLPISTAPPSVAVAALSGTDTVTNGVSRPAVWLGRSKHDPNGIRVALTAGLEDSSGDGAAAKPAASNNGTKTSSESVSKLNLELCSTSALRPDASKPGIKGSNDTGDGSRMTLEARTSVVSLRTEMGASASSTMAATEGGERTWRTLLKAILYRALEILGMQLRTLIILGMFGLECYWAYGLILYRGGWQLLLLIPNYLEQTLAGTAMLRAFMAGTHGRWKYVAPVPLLPFAMSSVYLVYGFITYPFGFADVGPLSWEKFIDLMDSCGVLSSTCWAIFSSLAYWQGNSVKTSYQFFNTDIFVGMLLMCFTDLLSTAHHLASTLQVPFKQWLRRELDVRKVVTPKVTDRLQGDIDL